MSKNRLSEDATAGAGRRLNVARRKTAVWPVGAALLLAILLIAPPAHAAAIVVDSAADTVANNGECTLREAMINANADDQSGSTDCAAGSGADAITFDADYTITLVGSQLPAATSAMTITGNGAASTIIEASTCNPVTLPGGCTPATYRVFEVSSTGNLTLDGVTVRHGRCVEGCATYSNIGGGILNNEGTLTVTNSTLSGNSASYGGGIYNNAASLTVTNSTLSGNVAYSFGGGIYNTDATLTVTNSTLSGNAAYSYGGGIYNTDATLTVTNSTLSGNSAGIVGGGIFNENGTATLSRSLISGNSAAAGDEVYRLSGTVSADDYNVFGHDGQTNADAFFDFAPGASDLSATSDGTNPTALAAILDPTLADNGGLTPTHALVANSPAIDFGPTADCAADPVFGADQRGYSRSVDGNAAASANECDAGAYEYGGQPAFCTGFPMSAGTEAELNEAITCYNLLVAAGSYTINLTADIDLTASTVPIDNAIADIELLLDGQGFTVDGQDISGVRPFEITAGSDATFDDLTIMGGNVPGNGGGINNEGTLTVTNSTVSDNSADFGGYGGGIFNDGGTTTVTNSTLSGNSAENGGGISNYSGTLTVTNSTLSGNMGDYGGGIYNRGELTLTNSTLSGNTTITPENAVGGIYNLDGTVTLSRSLISGNSALNSWNEVYNSGGTITADAYNVFGHSSQSNADAFLNFTPGASDLTATSDGTNPTALADILDTTLAENGGPTETHALVAGSPAIDFGPTADCAADPVFGADQRGEPRSIDIPGTGNDGGANLCDAGAYEVQLPPVASFCPVDDNVGNELTDLIGTGQGSPTKGIRNRKLVIPNSDEVVALYGQLAAVETGLMKYVRFLPQGYPRIQIHAPTSPAYRTFAVDWWGTDLPTDVDWVKGQFFWGPKGNKSPRAFVLWPTYETAEPYANVFATFNDSSGNHVAWEPGFIQTQTQVIAIPETQAAGADVTVKLALVDVNKDARSVTVTVEAGGVTVGPQVITVPNQKDTLNLETFLLEGVAARTDEVTITLESPEGTGDSAAMIGAAVSYACGGEAEPPVAKNDSHIFDRYDGGPGNLFVNNGSGPDFLGTPPATIISFGGGDLSASVGNHVAGSAVPFVGGTLTVNADGTWSLLGAVLDIGVFTFQYRLSNSAGISDATVTLDIYELCLLGDLDAPDC